MVDMEKGLFSNLTVTENVIQIVLLFVAKIAGLSLSDVRKRFAAPGLSMMSNARQPGSGRDRTMNNV